MDIKPNIKQEPSEFDNFEFQTGPTSSVVPIELKESSPEPIKQELITESVPPEALVVKHIKSEHDNLEANETDIKQADAECTQCRYNLTHKKWLRSHKQAAVSGKRAQAYFCGSCNSSKKRKPYQCAECGFASSLKSNLLKHIQSHSDGELKKCSQCDYVTLNSSSLEHHMVVHTKLPHKCSKCNFSSTQHFVTVNHYWMNHVEQEPTENADTTEDVVQPPDVKSESISKDMFNCKECEFSTWCSHLLATHMRSTHGSENLLCVCTHCHYIASCRKDLNNHLKIHRIDYRYKCNKCDFKALHSFTLRNHCMMAHTDDNLVAYSLKCTKCDYIASDDCDLFAHTSVHSDEETKPSISQVVVLEWVDQ